MAALTIVLSGVVFVRFVPIAKLSWSDEVVEWAFAWLVFMGSAALYRKSEHFCVDALTCRLEGRPGGLWHSLLVEGLTCSFFVLFTYYGYRLTISANDRSPILEWPRPLWYGCMPLAGLIMTGYSLRNIVSTLRKIFSSRRNHNSGRPGGAGQIS
jgi:TRAP-type C4-dicarboxylate transport system permease small subunit